MQIWRLFPNKARPAGSFQNKSSGGIWEIFPEVSILTVGTVKGADWTRSTCSSALRHQYCQVSASMLVLFIDHKLTQVSRSACPPPPTMSRWHEQPLPGLSTVSLLFLVANVTSAGLLASNSSLSACSRAFGSSGLDHMSELRPSVRPSVSSSSSIISDLTPPQSQAMGEAPLQTLMGLLRA